MISPRYHSCIRTLIGAVAIASAPAASADQAGLMQWSFNYYDTDVPVAIWYPATGAATSIDAGPFTLRAAPGAQIEQTPHPLIVISHGTGGSNVAHHPLAEALASAGFLVAAPTHPGDNYQDRSLVSDARYFDERPRQIHALLHALETDEKLAALIDASRIGAIGHSAGGYAVAAAIGATADRAGLIEHCQNVADDPSCDYADPDLGVSSPGGRTFALPEQIEQTTPSARIRAAALLAPMARVISSASQIDESVPVQIIVAEQDAILPHRYHLRRLQQIAPHAQTRQIVGAGHFSFIAPVNRGWREQLGEVAIDPPGFDRAVFNRQLGEKLAAWFDARLNP